MANDDLKNRWQPMVRHAKHVTAAQALVLAETGVWVPADRAFSHMGIETGYTGDPKIKSRGVNRCCPKPGIDCTSDCRAWGLFQIYWPPFRPDWGRLLDAAYNCYVGVKTLAVYYGQCGTWPGASNKFFTGVACDPTGVEDGSSGTDDSEYRAAMQRNMQELNQLGITATVAGGGGPSTDPKDPPTSTPDGGTNTPGEKCLPGTDICIDPSAIVAGQIEANTGRVLVTILGAALLLIGAWAVAK